MRATVSILLVSITFLAGCSTSLRQGWYNFSAYYNTFYNANQYYQAGFQENRALRTDMNPERPLRIHHEPTSGGVSNFGLAIENGAEILRDHSRSGYVGEAIELIGRSYYFRGEYFSALEKFQELYNTTSNAGMRQRAVIWEGRTYLEMGFYREGIRMMESSLESSEEWDAVHRAEAQAVLAQLYVSQEDWQQASGILGRSLDSLDNQEMKARGYFLYAQILEKTGYFEDAFFAFQKVLTNRPDFDLEYHSIRKSGDVLRAMGNYPAAFNQFRLLDRDDKYSGRKPEIIFELAKTEEMRGNIHEAESLYEEVLRYRLTNPKPETRAKTYYAMAGIYRDLYSNFKFAAAYYDSASMLNVDPELLPPEWDAGNLASSYNDYITITEEISRLETLLELGELSPQQRDSVLTAMNNQRMEELNRQNRQNNQYLQPVNIQPPNILSDERETTGAGFLNIRDRTMMDNARLQFRAIWGDRPLSDNWRRIEATAAARPISQEPGPDLSESGIPVESSSGYTEPVVNIEEIPLNESERDRMLHEIHTLYYQLGNVFLLNLNMPDSAKIYFDRVISGEYAENLKPRTLYALSDIALMEGNEQEARNRADMILEEYPESPLAESIRNHPVFGSRDDLPADDDDPLTTLYRSLDNSDLGPFERAGGLRRMALDFPDSRQAPYLLYEAAREYIRSGMGEEEYVQRINEWRNQTENWEQTRTEFFALQDSANSRLMDQDLSEADRQYWQDISQRTLQAPDLDDFFPYIGVSWDSARSVLNIIDSLYSDSAVFERSSVLNQELELPPVME